ncbi:NrdH-redoxin [Mycetocola tolaasinivorans]|uniref:NrdH-redoxin n=1 Tax=Mycetocola tolaasinivorans TaxID=76635 RepID=A0A3L7A106_9MICO|nr:glutaredoxin domain-containing protein [Mycetocola tolaasinivorans]RLP73688.1 NrdH-redoxin [Mycetocola tolaasinivorans]
MTSETTAQTPAVTMYGADWCRDCVRSKAFLEKNGVEFEYVDLVADETGAERAHAISGRTQIPVIVFPDGAHQVEPSDRDLEAKLSELGIL